MMHHFVVYFSFFRGGGGDPFNGGNQNRILTTFINFTIEFYKKRSTFEYKIYICIKDTHFFINFHTLTFVFFTSKLAQNAPL